MKKLTIKDFTQVVPLSQLKSEKFSRVRKTLDKYVVPLVMWSEIEIKFGKHEYKRFVKWMRGQTSMEGGVYPCDLNLFLKKQQPND